MRREWKGTYSVYIHEMTPLQKDHAFVKLVLTDGYYSNLRGSIIVRKDDVDRLGLHEKSEIVLGVSGSDISHRQNPLAAYLDATVLGSFTQEGRNIWANYANGARYIAYANVAVKFKSVDSRGSILFRKDTFDGMEIASGDTLFLAILRVKGSLIT
ncbi:hypothetical protein NTE_01861 [Candidatus Nitrososphaera evergladensis SR1]|uniref:Uncharacterized protein n=2 Tax=Nitrososphaera TaxID=497726 RepID=A0A075MQU8_9ARCH|nr:hypothetical protein NTE_01861 [Candidatus Nitrososphaera evergladensis SR1]